MPASKSGEDTDIPQKSNQISGGERPNNQVKAVTTNAQEQNETRNEVSSEYKIDEGQPTTMSSKHVKKNWKQFLPFKVISVDCNY